MDIKVESGTYTYNGNDFDFSFYTDLSAVNKIKFVNTVTDYIVGDNYNSVIRDLMFDFEIIDIFTDIDLTEVSESADSLSKIEEFLDETEVAAIVKSNMAEGLLDELNKAVDDNISYRSGLYRDVYASSFFNSLAKLVNVCEKKFNEIDFNSLTDIAQKLDDISLNNLSPSELLGAYMNSDLYKDNLHGHAQNEGK